MVANQSCILERDSSWLSIPLRREELPDITHYLVLQRWERDSSSGLGFPMPRGMKEVLGTPELAPSTPGPFLGLPVLSLPGATHLFLLRPASLPQIFNLSEELLHQQRAHVVLGASCTPARHGSSCDLGKD